MALAVKFIVLVRSQIPQFTHTRFHGSLVAAGARDYGLLLRDARVCRRAEILAVYAAQIHIERLLEIHRAKLHRQILHAPAAAIAVKRCFDADDLDIAVHVCAQDGAACVATQRLTDDKQVAAVLCAGNERR